MELPLVIVFLALHEITIGYCLCCPTRNYHWLLLVLPTIGYCLSCPTRNYHWLLFVLPYTKLPLVIACAALYEITIGYCLSCPPLVIVCLAHHWLLFVLLYTELPLTIVCLALHKITIGYSFPAHVMAFDLSTTQECCLESTPCPSRLSQLAPG